MAQRSEQTGTTDRTPRMRTFLTEVRAVSYPTPRFARITFGGGDLEDYASLGPAEFLYVLLPPPGRSGLTVDREFTWDRLKNMPKEDRPRGAYYTVREYRPEKAELDLDFLLHSEGEESKDPGRDEAVLENYASRWAAQAKPGDPAALWGPRILYEPPPGTAWQLLVADETGLPAVAAILRSLPEDARAQAFMEVADESEEQRLDSAGEVEITWLHRGGVPAGKSSLLAEAVRGSELPNGEVYVWGGAGNRNISAIRKHLRTEHGVDKSRMDILAYWMHTNDEE